MKKIQFGAVFPESGVLKFVMEVKYVMVIVILLILQSKTRELRSGGCLRRTPHRKLTFNQGVTLPQAAFGEHLTEN